MESGCTAFDAYRCLHITACSFKDTLVAKHQDVARFLVAVKVKAEAQRKMTGPPDRLFDGRELLGQHVSRRPTDVLPRGLIMSFPSPKTTHTSLLTPS